MKKIVFSRFFKVLGRFWWLIVLLAFICGASTYAIGKVFITPKYTADVTMYVWAGNRSDAASASENSASRSLTSTYIYILSSEKVLNQIKYNLSLPYTVGELSSMITANTVDDTEIIRVKVTSTNPEHAAAIANAVAEYGGPTIVDVTKAGSVSVIDYASVPSSPGSPDNTGNGVIGALAGALITAFCIVAIEAADTRLKSIDDLISYADLPVIAIIPKLDSKNRNKDKAQYYSSYGR